MPKVFVTTSWDDGHLLDLKLVSLLKKYVLKGTFYISPNNKEFNPSKLLNANQIKKLGRDFEIGAHTMTHSRLTTLDSNSSSVEIKQSKHYLEKLIGKKITSFCYPGGQYLHQHPHQVEAAGFRFARTTKTFMFTLSKKPFESPTSIHAYNHWSDAWNVLLFVRFNPVAFWRYFRHWDVLAMAMFDRVLQRGGVFHLWGHSWEIDNNHDWKRLQKVFKYISHRQNVSYVTNGELT